MMKSLLCVGVVLLSVMSCCMAAPVVLDIGHQSTACGAQTPDKRLNEFNFWLRYAGEVQRVVQAAGYECVLLNRGNPPAKGGPAGVMYMKQPDKNAKRYPSVHYPEHIGAGMVCADKAIDMKARCVV